MLRKEARLASRRPNGDRVPPLAGGVLADEVGLGKTYMAAGLVYVNAVPLTLVVTLVNLKSQWKDILKAFTHHSVRCCFLSSSLREVPRNLLFEDGTRSVVVITTYTQMRDRPEWATQTVWDRVILDEGHFIRNPTTSGFASLMALRSPRRWVLTATPIHNGIQDMVSLFQWIGIRFDGRSERRAGDGRMCDDGTTTKPSGDQTLGRSIRDANQKRPQMSSTTDDDASQRGVRGAKDGDGDAEVAESSFVSRRRSRRGRAENNGANTESELHRLVDEYVLRRTLASEKARTPQLTLPPCRCDVVCLEWDNAFESVLYEQTLAFMCARSGRATRGAVAASSTFPTNSKAMIEAYMRLRQICVSFHIYVKSLQKTSDLKNRPHMDRSELEDGSDKEELEGLRKDNAKYKTAALTLEGSDQEADDAFLRCVREQPHRSAKRKGKPSKKSLKKAAVGPARSPAFVHDRDKSEPPNDTVEKHNEEACIVAAEKEDGGGPRQTDVTSSFPSKPHYMFELDDREDDEDQQYNEDERRLRHDSLHLGAEHPLEVYHRVAERHPAPSASTKMRALSQMVAADFRRDPTTKTIIFTTFIEEMHIVARDLGHSSGLSCCKLHGSMTEDERANTIGVFMCPHGGVHVLIAQITCSATGINLQAANKVYITSPTWNPCIETQAVGRVYRQGQTREVTVVRLVMRGTVEATCLAVQERKKGVIRGRLPSCTEQEQQEEEQRAVAFDAVPPGSLFSPRSNDAAGGQMMKDDELNQGLDPELSRMLEECFDDLDLDAIG